MLVQGLLSPKCLAVWRFEVALGSRLVLIHDDLVINPHLLSIVEIGGHGLPTLHLGRIVLVRSQEVVQVLFLLLVLSHYRS